MRWALLEEAEAERPDLQVKAFGTAQSANDAHRWAWLGGGQPLLLSDEAKGK
jgi:hypothetical protein